MTCRTGAKFSCVCPRGSGWEDLSAPLPPGGVAPEASSCLDWSSMIRAVVLSLLEMVRYTISSHVSLQEGSSSRSKASLGRRQGDLQQLRNPPSPCKQEPHVHRVHLADAVGPVLGLDDVGRGPRELSKHH